MGKQIAGAGANQGLAMKILALLRQRHGNPRQPLAL
jgi:hypothetical protein